MQHSLHTNWRRACVAFSHFCNQNKNAYYRRTMKTRIFQHISRRNKIVHCSFDVLRWVMNIYLSFYGSPYIISTLLLDWHCPVLSLDFFSKYEPCYSVWIKCDRVNIFNNVIWSNLVNDYCLIPYPIHFHSNSIFNKSK